MIPGFADPTLARTAIAVAGMSSSRTVLIARNVTIALSCVPTFGLSLFSSFDCLQTERRWWHLPVRACWSNIHDHRPYCGMIRWNIGKKPSGDGCQEVNV